jgi:hypothetical protein
MAQFPARSPSAFHNVADPAAASAWRSGGQTDDIGYNVAEIRLAFDAYTPRFST